MTNTQKLITIQDLKQASSIAEIKSIWQRSRVPGSCEAPMSDRVAGGRLIEACIQKAKSCTTADEAKEAFDTLDLMGFSTTPNGRNLLADISAKWVTLCKGAEGAEAMQAHAHSLQIFP